MAQSESLYQPKTAFDLLSLPIIGTLLKRRYGRLILQIPFSLIALLLLYDGFTGPSSAAQNLATVVPWVHYRGLVVLVLLLAGNFFCMGCPFTLPRTLAKRLAIAGWRFPRPLRNKWLAILSLFSIFFLYEWLDLWASPYLTAWLIVAYFIASFLLEALFKESAFCKYVCPLGTFNFVYSTVSPSQIGVKNPQVCADCVGKECVNGAYAPQVTIRIDQIPVANGMMQEKQVIHSPQGTLGCGTDLFAPQIKSNLDCTFCLDCVRACPHDNASLFVRPLGRELVQAESWSKRWDVSFLVLCLSFMAMTNAFGMVAPIYRLLEQLAAWGFSEFFALLLVFALGSLVLPIGVGLAASQLTRLLTHSKLSLRDTLAAFAPAFVPLGFGIWLAHYGFHFLVAPLSIIPILQEFSGATQGDWARFGQAAPTEIIGLLQVMALLGGFLASMLIVQKTATRLYQRDSFIGMLPFALVLLLLMVSAYQIFALPMEMRGTADLFARLLYFVAA